MKSGQPPAAELRVLRTAPEPYAVLDDAAVHRWLVEAPRDYFDHLLSRLRDIAAGRIEVELPPKQVFADGDGGADFRVMPCVTRSAGHAIKTVKLVGTNLAQQRVPDQITVGKALVIDAAENYITHVVDACLLSSARTGLCAALAIHLLARRRQRLAVIGSGRVGYYGALYAATCCAVNEIVFTDIAPPRAQAASAALAARLPGIRCNTAQPAAIPDCDIVVLATTSREPLCAPPGWGADLVISLGADIDSQSELDPAWAGIADLYVDSPDTARFGDLRAWLAAGLVDQKNINNINDLLISPGASEGNRPRLFISTGSALFDNLTLEFLLSRQRAHPARR
jgi:ornithine cyclodeaminase/alanine dehydrogenase-like protein (mu-crystallin family)